MTFLLKTNLFQSLFQDDGSKTFLCVHKTNDVISNKLKPLRMLETKRRAPLLVDTESGHVIIGLLSLILLEVVIIIYRVPSWHYTICEIIMHLLQQVVLLGWRHGQVQARRTWNQSQMVGSPFGQTMITLVKGRPTRVNYPPCTCHMISLVADDIDESSVRVLDLVTFDTVRQFKVTENSIFMLRVQTTSEHNMMAVADTRTGVKVFDLRQPTADSYTCLYEVAARMHECSRCYCLLIRLLWHVQSCYL